jgi:RHS repeat-associated protein
VTFVYAERPDPFSEHRCGFEIRTRRRCERIEIRTHGERSTLTHTYRFIYLDQVAGEESLLPVNGTSLLDRLEVIGHDGENQESLPPLEFGYTSFQPRKADLVPLSVPDMAPLSLADPDYELVDLFGNGLPDILEMKDTVRYWRNRGGGNFDPPREMPDAPAGLRLSDAGVQLLDADGDGRADLLVTTQSLSGYYPLRFGGMWDRSSFKPHRTAPSFDLKDPEVRLVDLDGDGVTDAIRSGTRLECFFNHPRDGWRETRWVERRSIDDFPNVSFSDPLVRFATMTASGLQDVVLIHGTIEYWPSLGRGDWGRRVSMRDSPRFPFGYDPKRILLGDVDGDGLADIVYVDDTKIILWINQSGNGWSAPIEISGTPPVVDSDAVRLVDLFGTGVSGVLWSGSASGPGRSGMFFLDLTGGAKPYLLQRSDDHMGAVTQVHYEPSTHFYLEAEKRLESRWKTPLPFPVQVVARVEVKDELSGGKLTTTYEYGDGYWDGAEREFRGFGCVVQRDTEVFAPGGSANEQDVSEVPPRFFSPPTETRTWFHQGPIGDEFGGWEESDFSTQTWQGDPGMLARPPEVLRFLKALSRRARRDALRTLRGRVLRTELRALDGSNREQRPYTITEHLYGVCEVITEQDGNATLGYQPTVAPSGLAESDEWRVFFPHALAERTTQWERGDDPMTQISFTSDYDGNGQPCLHTKIGCPRRWRKMEDIPGTPYLATRTRTEYAEPLRSGKHIADRVSRVSTHAIVNNGKQTVDTLRQVADGSVMLEIIAQTNTYYDGGAFVGLPLGQVGDFGAPVRTQTLVLTEEIFEATYRPPEGQPPYLSPQTIVQWTQDYPVGFRDALPLAGGYEFRAAGPNPTDVRGYFANTDRRSYDFHDDAGHATDRGRGLVAARLDALGSRMSVTYDNPFQLLPETETDPAGLKTAAVYNDRVLQPREIVDPNGNRARFDYTPMGLLSATWLEDDRDRPSVRIEYDFLAYERSPPKRRQPSFVKTIRHVHHDSEVDVPRPERDETIETREYSDGFGRLLQTRTQGEDERFGDPIFGGFEARLPGTDDLVGRANDAADMPNVIVSGLQTYDNKSRVVETYERFFSQGWAYTKPTDSDRGRKATTFYDPRGQVVRTVNPNGSEQRAVYGVPYAVDRPDVFHPTPWEVYTYDPNDNAGRSHPNDPHAEASRHHRDTPSHAVLDSLGRTVETVERHRRKGKDDVDEYSTRFEYDLRGNLLSVTDALGRRAFEYVYDLTNRPLRVSNIDAGVRSRVFDAAGNLVEQRDSKGSLILHSYDRLNRLNRLWARDDAAGKITLRERLTYGDAGDPAQPVAERDRQRASNRLGRLQQHDDEAGILTFEAYDFKGNVLEKTRQVVSDGAILGVFAPAPPQWQVQAFRVDWEAGVLLDAKLYRTSTSFDALNRVKLMKYPEDVDGERKELRPKYNRAGALQGVHLDSTVYVDRIAYNAKGQRTLAAYGNGVWTQYVYDPDTFRLVRLLSERYETPLGALLTYRPKGSVLQDYTYEYDLVGNLVAIGDRAPESGIPNTLLGEAALDRVFEYDSLNRLTFASGRECNAPVPHPPWTDQPKCTSVNETRSYEESYTYDAVGNLTQLKHDADGGTFVRGFSIPRDSNRLRALTVGGQTSAYAHDANGNLVQENTSRHFEWDHSDHMRAFRTQPAAAEPSVFAHYLYDAAGLRVKRVVRHQGGGFEATTYIDDIFEHRTRSMGGGTTENNILHVMDDEQRVALVRVGAAFPNDGGSAVQFHLGDHLGSCNVVIDDDGVWTNREEYTPYGETSFGSFASKRYRFTGKEREASSSLNYHEARYYAPWLGRWMSCDPSPTPEQLSQYTYVDNKPLSLADPTGFEGDEPKTAATKRTISQEKKLGKAYEKSWQKHFQTRSDVRDVRTSTSWKDPTTGRSVRLNATTTDPRTGKPIYSGSTFRKPDLAVELKATPGEAIAVEVSSPPNFASRGKLAQAAQDRLALSKGLSLGDSKSGLLKGSGTFKARGLPVVGPGGNTPGSPHVTIEPAPLQRPQRPPTPGPNAATPVRPSVSRLGARTVPFLSVFLAGSQKEANEAAVTSIGLALLALVSPAAAFIVGGGMLFSSMRH